MPRRNRPPRWALVVIALVGTFFGTAAAAQPSRHGPPPHANAPSTVPPTVPPTAPPTTPPSTVPPSTVPPSTVPPTTEVPPPTTTEPPVGEPTTTTTEAPPPPSTTEPPIQEPTTTTTEAPSTTTTTPDDGRDNEVPPAPVVDDVTPTGGAAIGAGATTDDTEALVILPTPPAPAPTAAADDTDELAALPNARWASTDARALIAPPQPGETDTRPLWLAVLFGLAAGIGLTATASVVVNNLHREPARD